MTFSEVFKLILKHSNVNYIFGLLGRESQYISFPKDDELNFITMRDDRNVVLAAQAYGKYKRFPGVSFNTLGPGFLNNMIGLATAYLEKTPLISISAQIESDSRCGLKHQYVDDINLAKPITKQTFSLDKPNDFSRIFNEAINLTTICPQGPVYISIPIDLFGMESEKRNGRKYNGTTTNSLLKENINDFISTLNMYRTPVFVLGRGVYRSDAIEYFKDFFYYNEIFCINTPDATGIVPSDHERQLGTISKYWINFLGLNFDKFMSNFDLIVYLGVDECEGVDNSLLNKKLTIPYCLIGSDLTKNDESSIFNVQETSIKNFLKQLSKVKLDRNNKIQIHKIENIIEVTTFGKQNVEGINILDLIDVMNKIVADKDILISDVGSHKHYLSTFFTCRNPYQFLCSNGLASMGYGLPASIGIRFAKKEGNVFVIAGDGGFLSTISDLETLVRYNLNIKILVLVNRCFDLIQKYRLIGNHETIHTDTKFGVSKFAEIANAVGMESYSISELKQLRHLLKYIYDKNKPVLIELPIYYPV
jgi:acetolactate synthase I/II/III large subunit